MTMTVHNYKYRPRQFHRTSNRENRSRITDIWVPQVWQPTARPPARTMTTIPLQPRGLRGKKQSLQNFAHDTTGFSVVSWNVQKMLRYDNQKWKKCSKIKCPLKAIGHTCVLKWAHGFIFIMLFTKYLDIWQKSKLSNSNLSNVMDVQVYWCYLHGSPRGISFQNVMLFSYLVPCNCIKLVQYNGLIFSLHCGYWWPGALNSIMESVCWVHTYASLAVYGLKLWAKTPPNIYCWQCNETVLLMVSETKYLYNFSCMGIMLCIHSHLSLQ